MAHAKELKRGDTCPTCGGELQPAYVPTDKEFARFSDRENPGHLPMGADTANPDQRADLGELFRCGRCSYATRFPAEEQHSGSGASDRSGAAGDQGAADNGRDSDRAAAGASGNQGGGAGARRSSR
jgi:hypothetical protein